MTRDTAPDRTFPDARNKPRAVRSSACIYFMNDHPPHKLGTSAAELTPKEFEAESRPVKQAKKTPGRKRTVRRFPNCGTRGRLKS